MIGVVRAVSGTVNLALQLKENAMGYGMTCRRRDHAAMATPVTPAQVGECLVAGGTECAGDVLRSRRWAKMLATWSW
jgi:hypothetical protein